MRHLLEKHLWWRDWAVPYTNLATIIEGEFESPSEREDGRFLGWNDDKAAYDYDSWQYEGMVVPSALSEHYLNTARHYDQFLEDETFPTGWWSNFPKYFTSLLRAYYGDAARPHSEWGYHWLPKIVGDHSQLALTLVMNDGVIKGLFLLGQNVAMGGSNSQMIQRGLAKLDWLVVRDTDMVEAANLWEKGHPVRNGEIRPEEIGTEVFLMPAELAGEKGGTFTNTHHLVQWHDKVVDGPGDSRSELWFMYHLARRMKALYADSTRRRDDPIRHLTLDYPVVNARGEIDAEVVLREINGYSVADGRQLESFKELKDDGSTACGSWLYCGAYPGHNKTRDCQADGPDGPGSHLGWAFAWPANRRNLYNRASADPQGRPWSDKKRLVWWDEAQGKWTGTDEVDFEPEKRPDYRPDWEEGAQGMDAIGGDEPFIMMPDGRSAIYAPSGLKDGPLPTHYEPVEGPGRNHLHHPQRRSPVAKVFARDDNPLHEPGDPRFPARADHLPPDRAPLRRHPHARRAAHR